MTNNNFGKRLRPWNELRMNESVIAYNPHDHPIAREGGMGDISAYSEMPILVTDYYLGCFQRGALFPLEKVPAALEEEALSSSKPGGTKKTKGGESSCP